MKEADTKTRTLRFLWGIIPWLLVFLLVAFIVVMGGRIVEKRARLEEAKKEAMKKEVEPVQVITLTLEPRRLLDKIDLPAEVELFENLWVKAEATGQIIDLLVEEGQKIEKGQVLLKLDDRDYRTRLAQIEANYKLAKVNYDRTEALVKKGITPKTELDRLEATLTDLAAKRRESRLALSRAKIISPISGRLNELKAEKGDLCRIGDPVAQILQFDYVKVTVGIPESDVAAIFDLEEAEVVIEALSNQRVRGEKVFLSRKPQTLARLYNLELRVPNPEGRILPGMFARVELVKDVFDRALAVPLYAVISLGDDHFVYVERDGRAERRSVVLGTLIGWEVRVISGLTPGDQVIVVGHRSLDQGQPVNVIKNVSDPREILSS
jgi:RND family efflux transporter MFP subunit